MSGVGYVNLAYRRRMTRVKRLISQAHTSSMSGGALWERGAGSASQGSSNLLLRVNSVPAVVRSQPWNASKTVMPIW